MDTHPFSGWPQALLTGTLATALHPDRPEAPTLWLFELRDDSAPQHRPALQLCVRASCEAFDVLSATEVGAEVALVVEITSSSEHGTLIKVKGLLEEATHECCDCAAAIVAAQRRCGACTVRHESCREALRKEMTTPGALVDGDGNAWIVTGEGDLVSSDADQISDPYSDRISDCWLPLHRVWPPAPENLPPTN